MNHRVRRVFSSFRGTQQGEGLMTVRRSPPRSATAAGRRTTWGGETPPISTAGQKEGASNTAPAETIAENVPITEPPANS